MGATNQGYANLANTVLAIQRLNEVEKEGISRGELRRQQALATAEKTSLLQSKVREEQLQRGVEQQTGVGLTPETRALFAGPSQLLQPGAQTAEFLPQPTTTPGGFKIPGPQVLTTPSPKTIGEEFQRTGKEVRGESLANLQSVYGYEPGTPLHERMRTQSKVPIPSAVEGTVKGYEDALKRRADIRKTGVETQGLESDVRVKEATEVPRIREQEYKTEAGRQQVRSNELTYIYDQLNKPLEYKIKQTEAQIKDYELKRQPDMAEKLKLEVATAKQNLMKSRLEYKKAFGVQVAIEKAMSFPEDSEERETAVANVATLQGDSVALLSRNIAKQNAYMNGSEKAVAAFGEARKVLATDPAAAKEWMDIGNDWKVRASRIAGSERTTLRALTPQTGMFGGMSYTVAETNVPTKHASLWTQGLLGAAATGTKAVRNPYYGRDPNETDEFIPPDFALYFKIKAEHGADKPLNYYAKILDKEQSTMPVKEGALQRFQRADPSITTVVPTAEKPAGAPATGRGAALPTAPERMPSPPALDTDIERETTAKGASFKDTSNREFLEWLAPTIAPRTPVQLSKKEIADYKAQYQNVVKARGQLRGGERAE